MLYENLTEQSTMTELSSRFMSIRSKTEELCGLFSPDDHMLQAAVFVSPPKWHLAHTTWFFEEMILKPKVATYQEFDPKFPTLFNSYYETIGKRIARDKRYLISRPSLEEVRQYRAHVNEAILELITHSVDDETADLLELGLQHEQQHQELLVTDLKYSLYQNPTYPEVTSEINLTEQQNDTSGWIEMEEGIYSIGHAGQGFCFDNELGSHRVFLEKFDIRSDLVTNGEFKEFISDGGYENFRHWHEEGWGWVKQNQIKSPLYWVELNGDWHQYTYRGLRKVQDDDILTHISFFEAAAFANWKGLRLPTEFEWEVASKNFNWGQRWEWTNSAYLPYPGFAISDGAVGEYNGKFMINQMVLRGASEATAKGHSRNTYRNFFPTDAQWQCTGIRLAR